MADPLERYRPTDKRLAMSVLDRLIDADPDLAADPLATIGEQVNAVRESLRRDLEALLNTRRVPMARHKDLPELAGSLIGYGVDGFFATAVVTDEQRSDFARALQRHIRRFEPRLEEVRVSVLPRRDGGERTLWLRIDATYRMQPALPPISFETALDPSTQRMKVEAARG